MYAPPKEGVQLGAESREGEIQKTEGPTEQRGETTPQERGGGRAQRDGPAERYRAARPAGAAWQRKNAVISMMLSATVLSFTKGDVSG